LVVASTKKCPPYWGISHWHFGFSHCNVKSASFASRWCASCQKHSFRYQWFQGAKPLIYRYEVIDLVSEFHRCS
jgi:hypothetical protein